MAAERRREHRENSTLRMTPVGCVLICNGERIEMEVVNYHFRGACFRVQRGDYRLQQKGAHFLFRLGYKDLPEKINFRIVWETIADNGLFGVEFSTESSYVLARAERFFTNSINAPVISSQDPVDPNRIIYFKALNISVTGMLISTSLSNKHLFPGMELRTAILEIPGIGKTDVSLFIENCRSAEDGKSVLYGTSVKGNSHNYSELISKYLSNLGSTNNPDERLEKLDDAKLIHKNLGKHLTIKEISNQADYEKVLKLRYSGYSRAGKTKEGTSWREMGDGLDKEGLIIGAFSGGQLVASVEFRIKKIHGELMLSKKVDLNSLPGVETDNISELNRLVVHPKAQNSDVVLTMFQKVQAVAMMNGRPDGIIQADDKLVALYKRLGFKEIGYSFPHPTKPNTNINLMLIKSEAYVNSDGMNPYAWSVAFEESSKFFTAVGIQREFKLSLWQKWTRLIFKFVFSVYKKKKSKNNSAEIKADRHKRLRNIADPKWTQQHLNATIIYPYILEAQALAGRERIVKMLIDFGFEIEYFRKVSNWVSIEFFDEFISKFAEFGDPYLLNKNAGYRSTSKEVLGANYFLMKHFLSPELAFKSFEKYLPKFNKTRIWKILDSNRTSCRVRILNPDPKLVPKNRSAKENWLALIDAYALILTGESAKIEVIKSTFDGDPYCEFHIKWKMPLFSWKKFIATTSAAAGLGWLVSQQKFASWETVGLVVAGAGTLAFVGFSFINWMLYRRRYQDMIESQAEFERDADDKYKELQVSKSILEKTYQEGKLLESIAKEIQNSEDLTAILQIALDSLCTRFDFKRSFAMIVDDNRKMLRTTALKDSTTVMDTNNNDVWQFKVDISQKRENPMVLSSVYFTGQSILITNIDDHKFHLNETSRALVERLGTKGFAIVPIPSRDQNWGVLVADKGRSKDVITRRDLVALQRLAQSIGLALDKKAKIDSEIKVRKIFQKFVPSAVVESALGTHDVKLGGESREIVCLFMDIRNFTQMSSQVPPQILVEMLNRIFAILQKSISSTNGMIDKYLGDGALVTWGAIPGSEANAKFAIEATEKFSELLEQYNLELMKQGLSPVEVGFGIHKGPVVAGNVGSNERMEFTVIGSTVNIASRLEQLTKLFKSQVVVSEDLIDFKTLSDRWSVHQNVQVRGIDKPINVASLKLNQVPSAKSGVA